MNDQEDISSFALAVSEEISRLEKLIPENLTKIKILDLEINSLQKNIEDFVNDYYNSIGYLIEKLNNNISNLNETDISFNEDIPQEDDDVDNQKLIDIEIKSIYRKLARMCHPDISNMNGDEVEIFTLVNKAYADKNLKELIRLENLLYNSGPGSFEGNSNEQMEKLITEYDFTIEAIKSLEQKKLDLINSPANILRNKVLLDRLKGNDLVAKIKETLLKRLVDQ